MYELISRQEANKRGLTTYFTGKPCKHGHVCPRKVKSGNCSACSTLITRRWRENGSNTPSFTVKALPKLAYLQECFDLAGDKLIWKQRPIHHFSDLSKWKRFNSHWCGEVAGHYNKVHKYLEVRLDGKLYKGHRIIYKIATGDDSDLVIDHIDGDVGNNRPDNLRTATLQENARNSKKRSRKYSSKYKGVSYSKGYWYSWLTVDDVATSNRFKTEIEAALDYNERAKSVFGEFCQLNIIEG